MVLSLRESIAESNGEQSKEASDVLDHLRSFEKDNRQVITTIDIQKLEMEHKEFVMNYFMYHQQTNSVVEYANSFLELKRWAEVWNEEKFDENWVVSIFIKGLHEEIQEYVNLWCPNSLQRAIILAKWQELCLADMVFERSVDQNLVSNGHQIKEVTNSENRMEATYHEATEQKSITQVDFTCPLSLIYSCHPYVCSIPFISSALVINGRECCNFALQ